ncbi:MAG: Fe-S cluster assembly protein SufD [Bacteroidales bacterium]|jgi:Fe-S cluster assembly protein SufD|nr:Fe-S cluster assembly protein SufD [Bacteroidales bacterium]
MIRKDQLPNIWGDDWKVEKAEIREEIIPAGASVKIVITDNPWMVGLMAGKAICRSSIELIRINMAEESSLELYNIQGMETPQRHLSEIRVTMQQGSRLRMCTVTLGGQHVRNNVIVRMKGEHCELEADGLYLIDREQQCDNYIFVEHAKPNCSSRELYKGIIDERARARFNGHVLVQDGAVKTEAYQTNRNILLTDKAHVDTRPFLEIYNDDVKCSHGSTIGQLDEQAKFYLQTRGISERTAITMLSYAFCDEVIRGIGIPELRDTVGDMVKKRLHGELPCDECAIRCSTPCNGEAANFHIDPNKL